jgi:hypothetical protein
MVVMLRMVSEVSGVSPSLSTLIMRYNPIHSTLLFPLMASRGSIVTDISLLLRLGENQCLLSDSEIGYKGN